MSDLEALLSELAALDTRHDLDGLRRVRDQVVEEFPGSEAAAEALYKIGLDLLFRQRDLDGAVEKFLAAAKSKVRFWSNAARTSLGLCYYHQGRMQKALFELRKVGYQDPPSAHSVTALAFIEHVFDADGKPAEVARVRKDRIVQLRRLMAPGATQDAAERGFYLYSLGIALLDSGEADSGRTLLEQARDLGPAVLGEDIYRCVLDAL